MDAAAAGKRWPEVVEAAGQSLEPHLVAQYLRELAYAFQAWYDGEPILIDDADARNARLGSRDGMMHHLGWIHDFDPATQVPSERQGGTWL